MIWKLETAVWVCTDISRLYTHIFHQLQDCRRLYEKLRHPPVCADKRYSVDLDDVAPLEAGLTPRADDRFKTAVPFINIVSLTSVAVPHARGALGIRSAITSIEQHQLNKITLPSCSWRIHC